MNHSIFRENIRLIREECKDSVGDRFWYNVLSFTDLSSIYHSYPIMVKPSKNGNGVFAEVDIPIDTVITMYPAHHFTKKLGGNKHEVYQTNGFPEPNNDYAMTDANENIIFGCPTVIDNIWFLGHMINDVADLSIYKKGKEIQWLVDYCMRDSNSSNVKYMKEKDYVYVVTTRPIKAGEELLAVYGYDYWFHRLGCKEWKKVIFRYILKQPHHKRQYYLNFLHRE